MTETETSHPVRIFIFAIASTAIFAVMNVIAKIASPDCSLAQIIFFRSFLGFIPILVMIRMRGSWALTRTTDHWGHFWRGSVGVVSMSCFFASFAMLPMSNATAIHFASPLILTVLSIPMLGERVGWQRWAAVLIGLAAVFFMLRPEDIADAASVKGNAVAAAAAFLAALAMIFVRKLGRTEHALTIVFYFSLYGTILGGVAMIFMWEPLTLPVLAMLVIIGVMGGAGQILLTYAYAHAPAAYVAPFSYVSMIFAIGADILIWGMWPDWHIYTGSAVIMACGLFILYRETRKKKAALIRTNIYGFQPIAPTDRDRVE